MNCPLRCGVLQKAMRSVVLLLTAGVWLRVAAAQAASSPPVLALAPGGQAAEIQIAPAQTAKFAITVPAGQTVVLSLVEQEQTALVTRTDCGGKAHLARTNKGGRRGTIRFTLIGSSGGPEQFSAVDGNKLQAAVLRAFVSAPRAEEPGDAATVDAEEALAEGEYLWGQHDAQNARQALGAFDHAIRGAEKTNDIPLLRAALTWESVYLSFTVSRPKDALPLLDRATTLPDAGDVVEQANAWKTRGFVQVTLADYAGGWGDYERALELFRKTGDLFNQEVMLENRSDLLQMTGSDEDALSDANAAADLARRLNDRQGLLHLEDVIGGVQFQRGDMQSAFEAYQQALELETSAPTDSLVGFIETDLARLYHRLGAADEAGDMLARANAFWAAHPYLVGQVNTLIEQGRMESENGDQARASASLQQALHLARPADMKREQVFCLQGLGTAEGLRGETAEARAHLRQALQLATDIHEFDSLASIHIAEGDVALRAGDASNAEQDYAQALDLATRTFDHAQAIRAQGGLAIAEYRQGKYGDARSSIEAALKGIEDTRKLIAPGTLRTDYFATWHSYYSLAVEVLMRLAAGDPDSRYAQEAFRVAERGRARFLLDHVAAAGGAMDAGSDPALLASRSDTLRRLRLAEYTLAGLRMSGDDSMHADQLQQRIAALKEQEDSVAAALQRDEARNASPASLASDRVLTDLLPGIQSRLDDRTALLEYWVGERDVWLWTVTAHSLRGARLCATAELDAAAGLFQRSLLAREQFPANEDLASRQERIARADAEVEGRAAHLGRLLLPASLPAATRRLFIVPDGTLASVPFAALRLPHAGAGYLVAQYELVEEPSAAVAAALFSRRPRSGPLDRIAVFADPVYNRFDPRIEHTDADPTPTRVLAAAKPSLPVLRSAIDRDLSSLPRLDASQLEARAIESIAGANRASLWLGFDATPARVMGLRWSDYAIAHFAAHAVVDSQRPELSGIVLSMLGRKGDHQDGILWLHDIYHTPMPISLVVLDGCRTAAGKSIPGEGISGLAQAFLSAGASAVVGSLWTVDDAAAGKMIPWFYQALLDRHQSISGALRAAQLQMLAAHSPPYDWAGYIAEGNWRIGMNPPVD